MSGQNRRLRGGVAHFRSRPLRATRIAVRNKKGTIVRESALWEGSGRAGRCCIHSSRRHLADASVVGITVVVGNTVRGKWRGSHRLRLCRRVRQTPAWRSDSRRTHAGRGEAARNLAAPRVAESPGRPGARRVEAQRHAGPQGRPHRVQPRCTPVYRFNRRQLQPISDSIDIRFK